MDELKSKKKYSTVAKQAACLLEKVGWNKGFMIEGRVDDAGYTSGEATSFCLMGALVAADEETLDYNQLMNAMHGDRRGGYTTRVGHLCDMARVDPGHLMAYNDIQGKQWAIDKLNRMAEQLERRGQ